MQQAKFSLTDPLVEFLSHHEVYGFKDKSAMVRAALLNLREALELQRLRESADLYAQVYQTDQDLQDLTQAALADWPE